ncbi:MULTISPECIES: ribosome rescue GTPase HflX [Marichromatium]|uniref:GTPase HflX n=1 Tax=Marichromatium gracile TaxID=1048 RepID=A0A4R4AA64_MARGR|nr:MULTISPECIES: ribosome rescue GTPase HflX [Marichromatium]MBO8085957.1 GTPase HflX [Marichromatium sp.]MBK1708167.1 GTPase HflX [Marichromatium gracile]RNE89597.1 GTPase HflX [Marichromatium sp. AB31]RNE94676.1 GTPase HflX [Marichromatium sp. AB32]TCW35848.1 GTP-binding protein HflX [Marichromatium gracile]
MFERPDVGERAVLVQIDLGGERVDAEQREEFALLAEAAGAEVLATLGGSRAAPDPRYFLGSGKAEELKDLVAACTADLVIVDHPLSPAQERNLERLVQCRVLDRSGLILDIFAQRARSFEGKLQVELAQLRHLSTRLVRGWTHLERQKGGIGLRGPGETQLETDRRLLGKRVAMLERRLGKIEGQRAQGRKARAKAELSVVSLVGYTNAGKSTLFNRLTEAGVFQADQLFATLDPTLRRLELPTGERALLADTVGFVSDLPHELVAAFRSTLEEARNAALLLHVIDAAATQRSRLITDVEQVLEEIGCSEIPRLEVFNKIDRLEEAVPRLERDAEGVPVRVWISAREGEGIELLLQAIAERVGGQRVERRVRLEPADGRVRALLFAHAQILADTPLESGGWEMSFSIARADLARLRARDVRLAACVEP